ncbi:MAG: hypothetical protein ACRDF7_00090 [Candidatus Limnocylindrales bacterium]
MVPGTATSAYGFGTLGTTSADLTQLLRNTGGSCVMDLPGMIEVASASGPFQAVPVVNVGIVSAYNLGSGDSLAIVLSAWWWTGVRPDNGTPLPAPPCAAQINEVTRVKIPLASGSIQIDLETVWRQVCSSPASVSATFITR